MELPEKLYCVVDGDADKFLRAETEPADCLKSASDKQVVGEYTLTRRVNVVGVTRVDIENA